MNSIDLVKATEEVAASAERWLKGVEEKPPTPAELAKNYWAMKTAFDDLKAAQTRIYNVIDKIDKRILPALMEEHGVDMIRVPELGRSFSVRQMMSASMTDKEGALQWLRDNGHGDLVQETVNAGTLASFIRNLILEEGVEPPQELFKVSTYNKINTAKYTPK